MVTIPGASLKPHNMMHSHYQEFSPQEKMQMKGFCKRTSTAFKNGINDILQLNSILFHRMGTKHFLHSCYRDEMSLLLKYLKCFISCIIKSQPLRCPKFFPSKFSAVKDTRVE
jgi:hypothetical protein